MLLIETSTKSRINFGMFMSSPQFPQRLVEVVRTHRCILLVGPGLSKEADPKHFPNWGELLTRMLDEGKRVS